MQSLLFFRNQYLGLFRQDIYHTENTGYGNQSDSEYGQPKHRHYHLDLSTWYGKLIVIAAAAAVLALLFMVLSFLLPVILVVGVVLFLGFSVPEKTLIKMLLYIQYWKIINLKTFQLRTYGKSMSLI